VNIIILFDFLKKFTVVLENETTLSNEEMTPLPRMTIIFTIW